MTSLFSDAWMRAYMDAWNADPSVHEEFRRADFSGAIGYGFPGDEQATGMLVIEKGRATHAGAYDGRPLTIDMRAEPDFWAAWVARGVDAMTVGIAYASQMLEFRQGDYKQLEKDKRWVRPFIRSFNVMPRIPARPAEVAR